MGVPREEAENGPQAHAITKWLGRDCPDFTPDDRLAAASRRRLAAGLLRRAVELRLRGHRLQALIADLSARPTRTAAARRSGWSRWANDQGGKDNIAVALARHEP